MYKIRLDKQTNNITVRRSSNRFKIVYRRHNIKLKHVGPRGPQGIQGEKGDKGDTGVSTFVRVHHDTDSTVARPDAQFVEWVGNVSPFFATEEDTWVNTTLV